MSNSPRVLVLDVETTPLQVFTWGIWQQNIGINQIIEPTRVFCWAAKWSGEKKVSFMSEHHDGYVEMVEGMHGLLAEADVVVHFNGKSFDMPHLRREFLQNGLTPSKPVIEVDLMKEIKRLFRFPSNKLDYLSQALEVGAKVKHEGFDLWKKCLAGDDAAWSRMRKYNKGDVVVTDDLYVHVKPWIRTPHAGLFRTDGAFVCPSCSSQNVVKQGTKVLTSGTYQQWQCRDCGSWSRDSRLSEDSIRVSNRSTE